MPKRTNQPKKRKRMKTEGFRKRMRDAIHIIKNRRNKGRKHVSAQPHSK